MPSLKRYQRYLPQFLAAVYALGAPVAPGRADDLPFSAPGDSVSAEQDSQQAPEMVLRVSSKKRQLSNTSQVSTTQIDRNEIESLPKGDQTSLPDLLSATTPSLVEGGYGRIYLRQNENGVQYQLDGIQLPDLPSNTFQDAFLPRYIEKIDVLSGGVPAQYGERPLGVILITSREGSGKTEGSAEVNYGSFNTFSPEGMIRGRLNSDGTARFFLGANYNRTDRGLNTPNPVRNSATQVDQTQGGSDYVHDYANGNSEFGRVDWQIDNDDRLTLLLSNREEFWQVPNYPSSFQPIDSLFSPTNVDQFGNTGGFNYTPSNTNDSQSEADVFAELAWKHIVTERQYFQLSAYWQYYRLRFDNDPTNDLAALNLIPDSNPSSYFEDRHTNSGAVQGDYTMRLGDSHLVQLGTRVTGSQTAGVINVIGTNQSSPPPTVSATDSSTVHDFIEGVYVQDQWTLSDQVVVNAGLRFEAAQVYYNPTDIPHYDQWEPRIGVNYMPVQGTKLHAFYGHLYDFPMFENLQSIFAQLNAEGASAGQGGAFDIKPERDNYYEVGVEQQLGSRYVGSVTAYYKQALDLLDDAQLLNTSLSQPFNWSSGYAYGIELSLHGQLADHWSQFFNYSYGIAKGQGISGGLFTFQPGEQPQPGNWQYLDHVQLHTANTGVTYANRQFWWTNTGQFGSGLRTGPNNITNSPMHFSFDTSAGFEFLSHSDVLNHLKVSLDITNLFNNRYAVFVANGYNGSYYAPGRAFFGHLSKDFP